MIRVLVLALLFVSVAIISVFLLFRLLTLISKRRNRLTPTQVADKIEKHLEGTEGPWDWEHFTSIPINDDSLNAIRLRCIKAEDEPAQKRTQVLKNIIAELRGLAGGPVVKQ